MRPGAGTDNDTNADALVTVGFNPGWVAFDVTPRVQKWSNKTIANYGWRLTPTTVQRPNNITFNSSEYTTDHDAAPETDRRVWAGDSEHAADGDADRTGGRVEHGARRELCADRNGGGRGRDRGESGIPCERQRDRPVDERAVRHDVDTGGSRQLCADRAGNGQPWRGDDLGKFGDRDGKPREQHAADGDVDGSGERVEHDARRELCADRDGGGRGRNGEQGGVPCERQRGRPVDERAVRHDVDAGGGREAMC